MTAVCLWALPYPLAAQGEDCPSRLEAFDAAPGDRFGCAVSLSDGLLIVGALQDDDRGPDAGSAYVFQESLDGWTQPFKLIGSGTAAGDQLGFSVAIHGSVAVVGAPYSQVNGTASGEAYIFQCDGSGCHEEARLHSLTGATFGQFGFSVAVEGTTVAVGEPGANRVEIYQRSGSAWTLQARIQPTGVVAGDGFGFSVAMQGDLLLVGAPSQGTTGRAYIFHRGGGSWSEVAQLVPTDAMVAGRFGHSVAMGNEVAVVGAPDTGGGATYAFSRPQWSGQRLPTVGLSAGDRFGISVSIDRSSERIVVGASLSDDLGPQAGMAYLFRRSGGGWSLVGPLIDDRVQAGDEYGLGAAMDDAMAVVGAFKSGPGESGAAYGFPLDSAGQVSCGADLALRMSGPTSANVLDPLAYELQIDNLGPGTATGVVLSDPSPDALSSSSVGSPCSGGFPCALPDLAPGSRTTLDVLVEGPVTCPGAPLSGLATVTASTADPNLANNTDSIATTIVGCGDVSVVMAGELGEFCFGERVGYSVVVRNDGGVGLSTATLDVDLDPQLQSVTWTCVASAGAVCSASGVGEPMDSISLPAGSNLVYTLRTEVDRDVASSLSHAATIALPAGFPDLEPGNNRSERVLADLECLPIPAEGDFQFNKFTAGNQELPAVVADENGDFVVVWEDPGGSPSVQAQRMSPFGKFLGDELSLDLGAEGTNPAVAFGRDGTFAVAWVESGSKGAPTSTDLAWRRFAADGTALGSTVRVDVQTVSSSLSGRQVDIALGPKDEFVVVWSEENDVVRGQRFDASGAPAGASFDVSPVSLHPQLVPSLAIDGSGRFVVVWTDQGNGESIRPEIRGRFFAPDGSPASAEFSINSYTTGNQEEAQVVADDDGNFIVVWESEGSSGSDTDGLSIQGQRFGPDGSRLGDEFQVNTYTTGFQLSPSVDVDAAGNFIVAWSSQGSVGNDSDGDSIQAQWFARDGGKIGPQFQVNSYTPGDQTLPNVSTGAEGSFFVVWESEGSEYSDLGEGKSIQGRRFLPPYADPSLLDAEFLTFQNGRFEAELEWKTNLGSEGSGHPVRYGTDESGLFWFSQPTDWEILVKVIDGCAFNGSFWVYAAPLSDFEYTLRITDTFSGKVWEHSHPLGSFSVLADIEAFPTCEVRDPRLEPGASPKPEPMGAQVEARAPSDASWPDVVESAAPKSGLCSSEDVLPASAPCVPGDSTLCLLNRRFEVQAEWSGPDLEGLGQVVYAGTNNTGLFSFFHPDNWEAMVQIVDACEETGTFWFLGTVTSDLSHTLRVTDTCTGTTRHYSSPSGVFRTPIVDQQAFHCQ